MTWEELVEKVKDIAINPPYDGSESLRIGSIWFYKDGRILTGEFINIITFDKMYAIITALTETKESK